MRDVTSTDYNFKLTGMRDASTSDYNIKLNGMLTAPRARLSFIADSSIVISSWWKKKKKEFLLLRQNYTRTERPFVMGKISRNLEQNYKPYYRTHRHWRSKHFRRQNIILLYD